MRGKQHPNDVVQFEVVEVRELSENEINEISNQIADMIFLQLKKTFFKYVSKETTSTTKLLTPTSEEHESKDK